jgi:hypothetical protein
MAAETVVGKAEPIGADLLEPNDDELLTDWERDFLASIESQGYPLTSAQEDKLAEIEQLVEERREAWSRGSRPSW